MPDADGHPLPLPDWEEEEGACTVLLVEDEAGQREPLRLLLVALGFRVEAAADGLTGVHMALRLRPRAVIADLGLPFNDGYGLARKLRAALGNKVSLIALTGRSTEEDRRRSREAGFDAHLVKPVDVDELIRLLPRSPDDLT